MKPSIAALLVGSVLWAGACKNSDDGPATAPGHLSGTVTLGTIEGEWESPTPTTGIYFSVYNGRVMGFAFQCGGTGVAGFTPAAVTSNAFSVSDTWYSVTGAFNGDGTSSGTVTAAACGGAPIAWTASKFSDDAQSTVTVWPAADGSFTSSPAGINCPAVSCDSQFDAGTSVTLTAVPDPGFAFSGWNLAVCPSTGPCTLTLDQYYYVNTAGFH